MNNVSHGTVLSIGLVVTLACWLLRSAPAQNPRGLTFEQKVVLELEKTNRKLDRLIELAEQQRREGDEPANVRPNDVIFQDAPRQGPASPIIQLVPSKRERMLEKPDPLPPLDPPGKVFQKR